MQKRPQNFDGTGEDTEATLVTPRFDAEEARHAHPVVPLVEAGTGAPSVAARARYSNAPARPRRGPRRSWTTATLVILMLAAAATGAVVATKVMRRPLANAPAQTQSAPAQTEDLPAQTEAAQAEAAPAPSQAAGDTWGEEAPAAKHAPPEEATSEEARVKRPSRAPRQRESEAGMIAAPAEIMRGAVGDSDDGDDKRSDDERRGRHRERRREREDDDAEKEIRKALKHAKGKAPRLVDVLTGP